MNRGQLVMEDEGDDAFRKVFGLRVEEPIDGLEYERELRKEWVEVTTDDAEGDQCDE